MTDAQTTTTPAATATPPSQGQTPAATSQVDPNAAVQAPPAATPPGADAPKAGDKAADPAQLLFEEPPAEGDGADPKDGEEPPKDGEEGEAVEVKLEELTVPEDMPIPDELKGPLSEYIKDHKLDKDGAQKLTDLGVKMQQHNLDVWTKTKSDWRKEVEADPVLGGTNLKVTVAKANDVIRKFAGSEENLAELKQDLVLLGLGNKRSFVRFLNNIAQATGNDTAGGSSGGSAQQAGADAMAKRMYPNMA